MSAVKSVSSIVLLALLSYIATVAAAPYQELPPRAGYVPVYIRVGDTPLNEIHPKLAEAFHEIESSNLMLEDAGKSPDVIVMPLERNGALALISDQLMEESKLAETNEAKVQKQADETVATVVEVPKNEKESDIASFDVVKMHDAADAEKQIKAADKATDAAVKN